MKYYKDDIVELLNVEDYNAIHSQKLKVGCRYIVCRAIGDELLSVYTPEGCQKTSLLKIEQVMLYHRCIKQRIKCIFNRRK